MQALKYVSIFLLGNICLIFSLILLASKSLPKGEEGPQAEALADRMWEAIDQEAWENTGAVQWNFKGQITHTWDKKRHFVYMKWAENEVWLDINQHKGVAKKNGVLVEKGLDMMLKQASFRFNNDSYWLNPISKIKDPGAKRSLVKLDNGSKGLLVTYTSGGDTPGDSYLWVLDETGLPIAWQLWVKIVPIKGLTFSWENWKTYETGVKLSSLHRSAIMDLKITDIKTAKDITKLMGEDIFAPLETIE